jgi:hypothetical protein
VTPKSTFVISIALLTTPASLGSIPSSFLSDEALNLNGMLVFLDYNVNVIWNKLPSNALDKDLVVFYSFHV